MHVMCIGVFERRAKSRSYFWQILFDEFDDLLWEFDLPCTECIEPQHFIECVLFAVAVDGDIFTRECHRHGGRLLPR